MVLCCLLKAKSFHVMVSNLIYISLQKHTILIFWSGPSVKFWKSSWPAIQKVCPPLVYTHRLTKWAEWSATNDLRVLTARTTQCTLRINRSTESLASHWEQWLKSFLSHSSWLPYDLIVWYRWRGSERRSVHRRRQLRSRVRAGNST